MAKVTTKRGLVRARIEAAWEKSNGPCLEQIIQDCNRFVRMDQGQLRDSATPRSHGLKGDITYEAPYAKKVYYTGTPSRDVNPEASLQWCDKAHRTYKDDWLAQRQKAFEEGMDC